MGKNEHCFYRSIMQNMHGFGCEIKDIIDINEESEGAK